MKILLINNFHYRKGGSETVYFNNAKLLKEAGHEIVFFSEVRDENEETLDSKYFISDTSQLGRVKGAMKYFYNREAAKKLAQLIVDEKPDIAHAHLMWGCTAPAIFGVLKKYHIPLVHTAHDYRMVCPAYTFMTQGKVCEECQGKHFYKCVKNRCSKGSLLMSTVMAMEMYFRNVFFSPVKNIQGFIYVSEFAKSIHEKYSPKLANVDNVVLYNSTAKSIKGEKSRGDYFLYYGRLSYEKGIDKLIDAAKELPWLKLKIVGTGPIENELKSRVGISSRIEFIGYKKGQELYDIVANAQFVVVPSQWYENNPMTIVEAYSFGTPVIGSDLGGIPEIIENGSTGFIFKHESRDSLIHALNSAKEISNQGYSQMSRNAYRFYETHFSEEGYTEKLVEFYMKILNK